ncbi:dual specificity protein phosphatase family protein [bacterium]|nr:dual specificity protein phosphatase family protein [bacterium]
MTKNLLLILVLALCGSWISREPVTSFTQIENFHWVSDSICRSAQPSTLDFKALDSLGIASVLNLRAFASDEKEAGGSKVKLYHLRISARLMNEKDLNRILATIAEAPKPLLIHCKHGSDRTGVAIAAYRIHVEGWTKEQALSEFESEEYGYNKFWFPNLRRLIEDMPD